MLIEKISEAVGGLCLPWQMKRVAVAEAEIAVIKAHKELQLTDIKQRAILRFNEEQIQYQRNMEATVAKTLPFLRETAEPNEIDNDWLTYFFDKSRLVSDEQMQSVWARILAGESNQPGSFSKRTVNLLSEMSKEDAEILTDLRCFCWNFNNHPIPVIITYGSNSVFGENGMDYSKLVQLSSLGIISLSTDAPVHLEVEHANLTASYFGRKMRFRGKPINHLPLGCITPTKMGHELLSLCTGKPVDKVWQTVSEYWKKYSPVEISDG